MSAAKSGLLLTYWLWTHLLACHAYHIVLNSRGCLILQTSRIFNLLQKYFNENFWHAACGVCVQQIHEIISTNFSKIAIHENSSYTNRRNLVLYGSSYTNRRGVEKSLCMIRKYTVSSLSFILVPAPIVFVLQWLESPFTSVPSIYVQDSGRCE